MNAESGSNSSAITTGERIKIYTPEFFKEQPIAIDPKEIEYAKDLGEDEGGVIKVKLENDVVAQRIAKSLYKDPKSGFRELYNNEARAARLAKKHFGAKPRIEIMLDPQDRKLIIHGIDSLGMSKAKFREIYTYLGRSDNFDSSEVGQFGFGRVAYATMSDVITIETYSRETKERYAVMGRSGTTYTKLPEPAHLTEFGTRMQLTITNDIEIEQLVAYMEKVARYAEVDTFLILENPTRDSEPPRWNNTKIWDRGTYQIGPRTVKQDIDEWLESRSEDVVKTVPINIDNEDFSVIGVVAYRKPRWQDMHVTSTYHGEMLLCNTPVENEIDLPLAYYVVNVKNERKFMPTADRERLSDDAMKQLEPMVKAEVTKALEPFNAETLADALDANRKPLYMSDYAKYFMPFLNERSNEILRFLNTYLVVGFRNTRSEKHVKDLIEAGTKPEHMFFVSSMTDAKINKLRMIQPNAVIFRIHKYHNNGQEDNVSTRQDLLVSFGVHDGEALIIEKKLKLPTKPKSERDVTVHYAERQDFDRGVAEPAIKRKTKRMSRQNLVSHRTISIQSGTLEKFAVPLGKLDTRYELVVDDGYLGGEIRTMELFLQEEIAMKDVITNKGEMTMEELVGKNPVLILYPDSDLLKYYENDERVIVAGDEDYLFKVASYLASKDVTYVFDVSAKDRIEEEFGEENNIVGQLVYRDTSITNKECKQLFEILHMAKALGIDGKRYTSKTHGRLNRAQIYEGDRGYVETKLFDMARIAVKEDEDGGYSQFVIKHLAPRITKESAGDGGVRNDDDN